MIVEFFFPPLLFERLESFAARQSITMHEALRRAVKAHIDGACPYCGSDDVEQTAKHSDLSLNDSVVDLEYDDVTIHQCADCGRYHAYVG
jgi:hypothetical protein